MGEASLQLGPDTGVISDEIAGLDQKIEEVEAPGTRFQRFVSTDSGLQRLMQERSEICVVCRDECIQLLLYDVSADEHLVTRACPESGAPSPLPTPASSAHKATERCFETIVVAATHGFGARVLRDEALDLYEIARQIVVWPRALGRQGAHTAQLFHYPVDSVRPFERVTSPRCREIAMLDEVAERAAQRLARRLELRSPAEDAADTLRGGARGGPGPRTQSPICPFWRPRPRGTLAL